MFLDVRHIEKSFGRELVLDDLHFSLEEHRTLSVLGRSGSGKTTLLRIIAGLEQADRGELRLAGETIDHLPAHQRNIVYLYQEPLLFPHLNVFENIAFGLRLRGLPDAEVRRQTNAMLEQLELADQARKRSHQLSGGQRQRVNFGRALVINPRLLLLDEPFGALDVETRAAMQQVFQRMVADFRLTAVFVTHDLKEALLMGDDIASLRAGRLHRYADKRAFIEDPETGVRNEIDFWTKL